MNRRIAYSLLFVWYLLSANTTLAYTHADTLRGSNGRGRSWWKVQKYSLEVQFDFATKTITGENKIDFSIVNTPIDSMQIDLQDPLRITKVTLIFADGCHDKIFVNIDSFKKDGNVWWIKYPFHNLKTTYAQSLEITYEGEPRIAVNPPWDGGFSWSKDSNGNPWVAVSCQGLGASIWWPCKDAQWDEPDSGMNIKLIAPARWSAISNGRELSEELLATDHSFKISEWQVKNPINNYDATFYIGDYIHWHDTLMGEKGMLDLDFWALRNHEEQAKKQFAVVKQMIHCYEYWLGPYPFYEDGYKLVEAPYLGMEHQSAIAYGNQYKMGYLGYDRSMTGYGMKFDYIIIHESGHEWFGNSITAKDIADNWIHEGITTFDESLFAECIMGKEKAQAYCRGEWHNIQNDKPIIGDYGVNDEGSEDMYDKGAAIMYMIRQMTNDDEKFRLMMRGLSKEFYHQVVTTKQVEDFISAHTGLDLHAFFNQYLRTTKIPELEYAIIDKELSYRFNNVVEGFTLPIAARSGNRNITLNPTTGWQKLKWKGGNNIKFSKDLLITVKE